MAQHLLSKKSGFVESNYTDVLPGKASAPFISSLTHESLTPSANTLLPCTRNPTTVGFTNVFPEKHISWVCRSWKNACNALFKQGLLRADEEVIEPDLHAAVSSSSEVKCRHQGKLEVLSPFERHILLFMSKRPLLEEHMFLHADNNTLRCKCAHNARLHVDCIDDDVCASSVGIFLQAYAKDGVNLVHRLMDGKWPRRQLHTLAFARLRGEPGMMCANVYQSDSDFDEIVKPDLYKESRGSPLPLLRRICVKVFTDRILRAVPQQQQMEYPNKEMLDSVQDFFLYTEFEGKQVFDELDRDADGKLTIDDVKLAMRKMKLPADYAQNFMQSRHQLWPKKTFGWPEFSSLIQKKEPVIIQLFNSLGVSKSGTVSRTHVKDSLKKAGLSATEANVSAMIKFLAADTGEYIEYGQFRRFMLLIPAEQLNKNPWSVWLKAATAAGSVEPSSEELQDSVFKYITSLPRTFQTNTKQKRFESEAIPC